MLLYKKFESRREENGFQFRVPNLRENAGAGAVLVHRKSDFAGAGAVLVRPKIIFPGAGAVRCTKISKLVVRTGAVRAGAPNLIN